MNIYELENYEINPAIAYALGLIYPLYKEKQLNDKKYIVGSVNHNPNMITLEEINKHFLKVYELFDKYIRTNNIEIKTNKCTEYTLSSKKGFSILIENTNVEEEKCIKIMTKKVEQIKDSTDDIKKQFVKGCFDGRSSWDKTGHFLSIDVDRDSQKQNLIAQIIESLGIEINVNTRGDGHDKNDQIRIKRNSLELYMQEINFYSIRRANIINEVI